MQLVSLTTKRGTSRPTNQVKMCSCLLGAVSRSPAEGTKTINQAIILFPSFLTTALLPGYLIIFYPNCATQCCVRNIQRAKAKWAAVSKVLKREGASKKFYLVIVSTVLLYGSDTWVVTRRMEELLTSFHNRCLRHITKRFIRCTDTENDI